MTFSAIGPTRRRLMVGAGVLSMAALAALPRLTAGEAPTQPAAASKPAAPATSPAGVATYTVKRGDLNLEIRAEAVFDAVDPYEAKVDFKVYGWPLVITAVAPPGSPVIKDQTLIAFDRRPIEWALTAAENELAVAKANLAKGQADAEVAAKSDPMALRQAEEGLKNAEAAKKWYDEVDGPQMLAMADLQVKQNQFGVEDRTDELEQLKKMYGAEELTAATADIVMRRSVRALELAPDDVEDGSAAPRQDQGLRLPDEPPARHRRGRVGQASAGAVQVAARAVSHRPVGGAVGGEAGRRPGREKAR